MIDSVQGGIRKYMSLKYIYHFQSCHTRIENSRESVYGTGL